MMRIWLGMFLAVLWGAAAAQTAVQVGAEARRALSLTIYHGDLAMVREVRHFEAGKGETRLAFSAVSASIKPETAALRAKGLSLIEQNFDFDPLTPARLLEQAVGGTVRLVRTNPATGAVTEEVARVLAANDGVVLQIGERVEVLRDDGLPTRVIFDRVPARLQTRPTLSVLVASTRAGAYDAELAYLTGGLSWRADYVAHYDEKTGRMDLQGWMTLTNRSGVAYEDALIQLVAGEVRVVGDVAIQQRPGLRAQALLERAEMAREEALFDYHLYTLPRRATIADNQTKQVAFLAADKVGVAKGYRYDAQGFETLEKPRHADVELIFDNAKANGLGAPLPKGIVRVYGRDGEGRSQFLGEDEIVHAAQGAPVALVVGQAFDVTVAPRQEGYEVVSRGADGSVVEVTQSYDLRNARDEAVVVTLRQGGLRGDWRVVEQSQEYAARDATTATWRVKVPAKGKALLRFKLRIARGG